MRLKKHLLITFALTLLFLNLTCSNTTGPEEEQPGRRDYVWTVDTINLPFSPFTDITGTSPNDVWVCSPGEGDKIFYHYDGQSWQTDFIPRVFSPLSISSLNKNAVWSSGFDGKIWFYNETIWSQYHTHNSGTDTSIILQEINGITSSEIYSVGQYYIGPKNYWGIVLYYQKNSWSEVKISKTRTLFAKICKSNNGKIYLWGLTQQDINENNFQFYELDGKNLKEIYSGSQNTNAEYGSLLQLDSETYFIIGYDFFSYDGNTFSKIGRLSDSPKFMNAGIGRSIKDIFLGMRDGIAHYNGKNTVYLIQSHENVFVRKGLIFEKEVFFLGRDVNGNNLIFRGKLND